MKYIFELQELQDAQKALKNLSANRQKEIAKIIDESPISKKEPHQILTSLQTLQAEKDAFDMASDFISHEIVTTEISFNERHNK